MTAGRARETTKFGKSTSLKERRTDRVVCGISSRSQLREVEESQSQYDIHSSGATDLQLIQPHLLLLFLSKILKNKWAWAGGIYINRLRGVSEGVPYSYTVPPSKLLGHHHEHTFNLNLLDRPLCTLALSNGTYYLDGHTRRLGLTNHVWLIGIYIQPPSLIRQPQLRNVEIQGAMNTIQVGDNAGKHAAIHAQKLEKLQDEQHVEKPFERKPMKFRFPEREQSGRSVVMIKNLGFEYDGNVLFKKANLIIERGEKLAIIGPNGCGKSTLLRLIMGYEKPTHGRVSLGEHNVNPNYFEQNQWMELLFGSPLLHFIYCITPYASDEIYSRIIDKSIERPKLGKPLRDALAELCKPRWRCPSMVGQSSTNQKTMVLLPVSLGKGMCTQSRRCITGLYLLVPLTAIMH
eukprot:Gb_01083 [translate_table: standard]